MNPRLTLDRVGDRTDRVRCRSSVRPQKPKRHELTETADASDTNKIIRDRAHRTRDVGSMAVAVLS